MAPGPAATTALIWTGVNLGARLWFLGIKTGRETLWCSSSAGDKGESAWSVSVSRHVKDLLLQSLVLTLPWLHFVLCVPSSWNLLGISVCILATECEWAIARRPPRAAHCQGGEQQRHRSREWDSRTESRYFVVVTAERVSQGTFCSETPRRFWLLLQR